MKKRIVLVLAALLCMTALLCFAAAAEEISGTCGENLTWTFKDGTLTISGTGEMQNYSTSMHSMYAVPWVDYIEEIEKVVVEEGVTYIGEAAFYKCTALTKVQIADSVTVVGDDAFKECTSLKSITLPNGITQMGDSIFASCSSPEK